MKYFIVLVLYVIMLLLNVCASPLSATTNKNETPEKTIEALFSAIASNQLDAALAVCFPEPMASGFDFTSMIERFRVYNPQAETLTVPSTYMFYQEASKQILKGLAAKSILLLSLSFLIQDEMDLMAPISADAVWAVDFIQKVDPAALHGLKILRIAAAPHSDNPLLIEAFTQQAQVYGSEESVERVVLLEFRDKKYICSVSLLRYGSIWYIRDFRSSLPNLPSLGIAYQVPDENLQDDSIMKIFE